MQREDLVTLIANAIREVLREVDARMSRIVADRILREMRRSRHQDARAEGAASPGARSGGSAATKQRCKIDQR
jgi:hypothetical protein